MIFLIFFKKYFARTRAIIFEIFLIGRTRNDFEQKNDTWHGNWVFYKIKIFKIFFMAARFSHNLYHFPIKSFLIFSIFYEVVIFLIL